MAEEAARAEHRRTHEMTTRKTAQGDRIPKFPDTSPLLDLVEELREELTALYDEAAAMQERNDRMARSAKPDTSRFPAMKEA